eukprot:m.218467 g.218467  ORF g.218467 m.218467 type:complete len:67 (+) comp19155_c0_seq6:359-559(+)
MHLPDHVQITAPQQIDGARNIDRGVEYAGSVEEALAYIADAGMMWADRPGMEDWVPLSSVCPIAPQ